MAGTIGPQPQKLLTFILENRPRPEKGYQSCLGVLRLKKRYSRKNCKSILKRGLDQQSLDGSFSSQARPPLLGNENLR